VDSGGTVSQLTWSEPHLWPLLLLLPLCWLAFWWLFGFAVRGGARYGAMAEERGVSPARRASLWTALAGLLLLCWMAPLLGEERVAVERRGLDVIFCLDTSRSMLARDLEPDRLARAKRDIDTVLPLLVGGDRVALIAFAGRTRLIVPLTHDLDSFRQLMDDVDTDTVRTGGSDLAAALRGALQLSSADNASTTVIVLLTDGEDLTGAGQQAAAEAAARGVVVHAVGYGSTRGTKIVLDDGTGKSEFLKSDNGDEVVSVLDADGLRDIARTTGGEFVRADAMPLPLVELKKKRIDPLVKRAYEAGEDVIKKPRFQWVLLPAVLLLIVEILRYGARRR